MAYKEYKGRLVGYSKRHAVHYELDVPGYGPVRVWCRPYCEMIISNEISNLLRVELTEGPYGWDGGPTSKEIIDVFDSAIQQHIEHVKLDRRLR